MLEYHADAQTPRHGWVAHRQRPTLPANLAAAGLGDAVDDLHQRAFAGAVLAEQGTDLAWGNGQVDTVVGQAAGVLLADGGQLQAWKIG